MLNYEILEKLTRTIGVSGEEDDVRSVILSEIEPYADEIHISPLGNILAFKKGEKRPEKKLMLCAHMDEVGFVITNITENGLLKFTTVGNIRPEVLSGRDVLVGGKTPGVICAKPVHLLKGDEFEKPVPVNELAIDIGADTREQAETLVQIGDNACFVPFFERVHGTVKAKALDDRVGCFALITLMQRPLEYDTYFVFSTQEEIGLRGAGTAAYILEPDAALVLEGTTAGDIPGVSRRTQRAKWAAAQSFPLRICAPFTRRIISAARWRSVKKTIFRCSRRPCVPAAQTRAPFTFPAAA